MSGKLYLIPTQLGNCKLERVIPAEVADITRELRYFIAEDVRTARRYLSQLKMPVPIQDIVFSELNEHTQQTELEQLLKPVLEGNDAGIISEAGVPGVADPGADLVAIAHRKGIEVVPLVGPSSILLALMASGMNGQNFAFVGYLPVKPLEREQKIRFLEKRSQTEHQSQLFIETPYRNNQLLESLVKICQPETRLCIAANITSDDEFIKTRKIGEWKKHPVDLHKKPCIFILQA